MQYTIIARKIMRKQGEPVCKRYKIFHLCLLQNCKNVVREFAIALQFEVLSKQSWQTRVPSRLALGCILALARSLNKRGTREFEIFEFDDLLTTPIYRS